MQNTYIISDYKPEIKNFISIVGIPESNVISFQTCMKESDLHDWTTAIFKDASIDKLLLPITLSSSATDSLFNTEGLKIALHIRLNYELSVEQRSIPIIFLSDFNLENLLKRNNFDADNNPQYLFFTKGSYLSRFDEDELKATLASVPPCSDYQHDILKKLKISQKASEGKHSIANAWGCYKLAQASGYTKNILQIPAIADQLKTLYAKYLICLNDAKIKKKQDKNEATGIHCKGKKILFIDDQEDEGWVELMCHIFDSAEFVSIDSKKYKNEETKSFHDFEGFLNECREHIGKEWDLIILDLRLNPATEDIDEMIDPTKLSGNLLIDEFLKANAGYQILVSTASNKIWNVNAALKRGAVAYYIKESPEFNYSKHETQQQYARFIKDIKSCFERKYLWQLYDAIQKLNTTDYYQILKQICTLLKLDDTKDDILNQCLLLCFHILEDYCNQPAVGDFGFYEDSSKKLSSGSVFDKNKEKKDIFLSISNDKISTYFELKNGVFPFQTNNKETVVAVDYFPNKLLISSRKAGLDSSALVKMISVLKYRDNLDADTIKEIIKLRYYRSNVAAHNTGNIDANKYKITKNEIVFFMNLFESIFCEHHV